MAHKTTWLRTDFVRVMKQTGKDLNSAYKETSLGGLAKEFGFEDEN